MNINYFGILGLVGKLMAWAQKALQDGKIDAQEAAELVAMIADVAGFKAEIQL